jgi:hypothetical protein
VRPRLRIDKLGGSDSGGSDSGGSGSGGSGPGPGPVSTYNVHRAKIYKGVKIGIIYGIIFSFVYKL